MSNFKELGTSMVGDVLSGATGPLGALFGDKHATSSYNFPMNVEDLGERHFIRFNVIKIDGSSFKGGSKKSSTSSDTNAVGELIGGSVGAAVGGGIGGGLVGAIAGNAADSLGVSSAVANIADAGVDVASSVVGGAVGVAGGLAGGAMGAATDLAGGALGAAGDLAGGAVGAVGDLLSGNLPEIPSLEDLKVPLPNPMDILNIDNAWGDIQAAASATWGNLSSAASSISGAVTGAVDILEDSLKGLGEDAPQDFSGTSGTQVQSIADIILYIPHNITESYQSQWTGGSLGAAGALADEAMKVVDAGFSGAATALMKAMGDNAVGGAAEVGGQLLGDAFSNPDLQGAVLKKAGIAIDPKFELLFTGVQPRTFTFDFKMAPRNATEAQMIANIIRIFKMYSAPGANQDSSRYWTLPMYFQIEYWNSDKTHKIKPCALTGINVNYTGSGDNHTFYDGYPIQTDLSLTFMESALLTREDFESGDNGGY